MKCTNFFAQSVKYIALTVAAFAALVSSAVTIPNTPLVTQVSAKPMVMLVAGKDHKLFYEAYNDAGDIDGDGSIDIRFKPSITYYGLFDSKLCYTHNGQSDNTGLFKPVAAAGDKNTCAQPTAGADRWSGNWLNYITTARIDALRKVLYGGYREVDTATQTILRRAYIPQDAHSWAKEYTSEAVDGYNIKAYTPIDLPTGVNRHFFGNLTVNGNINCATLSTCSGEPPRMVVITNSPKRVWEWASTERPVLDGNAGGTRKSYTVRAEVCTTDFKEGCKQYGSVYKPTGLLHDYGESDAMLFGLITGSYDNNLSGGRLRKVVSSFKDEVDPATGVFTINANIVRTFNNLRIRDYNNGNTDKAYKGGWLATAPMAEGNFPDWGNPIAEMMYEGMRYFAGKALPTASFNSAGTTVDSQVGLSTVAWDDPYAVPNSVKPSAAKAPRCAKANFLTISDINPSFDSDQLPGSSFGSALVSDMGAVDVTKEADRISKIEKNIAGNRFIGESLANFPTADSAPTIKNVTSLGNIRGLAPEEPTKQGSYYSAAVSSYAKRNDLRADLAESQSIDTFAVALASPLPRMEVRFSPTQKITLVPFAKSVGGFSISNATGSFQPTNQIVDFYVEKIVNSGPSDIDLTKEGNFGNFYAKFRINYEDVEQGADHDMDAIVEYEVTASPGGTVTVKVTPTYEAGGIKQNMGYIISGTDKQDGVYLVVQDENQSIPYFLNVPPGQGPGYCIDTTKPGCNTLPNKDWGGVKYSERTFTAGGGSDENSSLLKDPLWYAAKWGGFNDLNPKTLENVPDLASEWDTNGDGVPDTYFLVQNPLKLKDALKRAFDAIFKTNSSASNVIANSSSVSSTTRVFQARFNAVRWSGDLVAYPITDAGVSTNREWSAASKIPAEGARKLFVRTTAGTTEAFKWSVLPSTDQGLLGSENLVNYLRGDRTNEVTASGGIFRPRAEDTVLGDIVHSAPFYEKDSDVVYVGANDGMLHAFKASDGTVPGSAGTELFGFIPSAAIPRLKNTAATGYVHEYFVDGDVTVSPKTTENGLRNLLFAAMGRGGKGLFSLDVTSPTTFDKTKFLWEYTPTGSTAAASDDNLGLMLGRPIYARMWVSGPTTAKIFANAVIMGNGYNSTNGKAVLYIFLLNDDGTLNSVKQLDTLVSGDNGLATPAVFDADGDGIIDNVYAGDLKGNVWKFDVKGGVPGDWKVDLSPPPPAAQKPLFTAVDASGNPQPITAPITVAVNVDLADVNAGKRFLFFGTGAYFRTGDPTNVDIQTWYGLIDQSAVIPDRSSLMARTIAATGDFGGKNVRTFSVAGTNDMSGKNGWYLDFTAPPGERMVTEPLSYKLAVNVLVSSSIIPSGNDPCIPGGTGYVNALNPFTGGALGVGILDVNNNKNYKDDTLSGMYIGSVDLGVGLPSRPTLIGSRLVVGGTNPDDKNPISDVGVDLGLPPLKGRISWREIIKD